MDPKCVKMLLNLRISSWNLPSEILQTNPVHWEHWILPGHKRSGTIPVSVQEHQTAAPDQPPHGCGDAGVGQDSSWVLNVQYILHQMDDTSQTGLWYWQVGFQHSFLLDLGTFYLLQGTSGSWWRDLQQRMFEVRQNLEHRWWVSNLWHWHLLNMIPIFRTTHLEVDRF